MYKSEEEVSVEYDRVPLGLTTLLPPLDWCWVNDHPFLANSSANNPTLLALSALAWSTHGERERERNSTVSENDLIHTLKSSLIHTLYNSCQSKEGERHIEGPIWDVGNTPKGTIMRKKLFFCGNTEGT